MPNPRPGSRVLISWSSQLHHPPVVTGGEIGIQAPPQPLVEALGAIDVGHRKDDDLELQIDDPILRVLGCVFTAHLRAAHDGLLGSMGSGFRVALRPPRRARGRHWSVRWSARSKRQSQSTVRSPRPSRRLIVLSLAKRGGSGLHPAARGKPAGRSEPGVQATFAASSARLSPSTRLKAGKGWMTSASVFSGVPSLIASTSSPRISPARGVTRVAPISTPRLRSPTSLSAPP